MVKSAAEIFYIESIFSRRVAVASGYCCWTKFGLESSFMFKNALLVVFFVVVFYLTEKSGNFDECKLRHKKKIFFISIAKNHKLQTIFLPFWG